MIMQSYLFDAANLKGTNLAGVLFDANTDLTGATMPDGSIHP